MPAWADGLTKVTDQTGETDVVGTKYRLWFGPFDERIEVLAADRPFHYRTRSKFGTIRIETSVTFEDVDGTTRMREAIHAKGLKGRLWARIFAASSFPGNFARELERFAQTCEREELRRPVPVMVRAEVLDDEPVLVMAKAGR
jgi:hypothetical protein